MSRSTSEDGKRKLVSIARDVARARHSLERGDDPWPSQWAVETLAEALADLVAILQEDGE